MNNELITKAGDELHTLTDRLTGAVDSVYGEVGRFREVLDANPILNPFVAIPVDRYLKKPDLTVVTKAVNEAEVKLSQVIQSVDWLF